MKRSFSLLISVFLFASVSACGTSDKNADSQPGAPVVGATTSTAPAAQTVASPIAAPATPRLPVTVNDKDGRPVTIGDVSRILALNGEITEIVFALGLGENVIGIDTSVTYPPQVKALPTVGYQRALAAEGILGLRPSVIIGNENAGPPAVSSRSVAPVYRC